VITGTISAQREGIIRLTLSDAYAMPRDIDFMVDTGYTGELTLPPELMADLGLRRIGLARLFLGDGHVAITDDYEAAIDWYGESIVVTVSQAECEPLIGMSLMYGFELVMPILESATLKLERLAPV
jgi:clan AA aspartic protease